MSVDANSTQLESTGARARTDNKNVDSRRRPSWLARRFRGSPRLLWAGNLLLLAISVVWLFADPGLYAGLRDGPLPVDVWLSWRTAGVAAVLLFGGVNLLWLALGLWLGDRPFRQLKALVVLVTLISLWLGLGLNYQAISWQGRRWRVLPYVNSVETLAKPLIASWPAEDGDVEGIGPFMAYPIGRPTTLILLTPPRLTADGPFVSAIEKSADGALRFELSDAGGNDWLEWHPDSTPDSHTGGLLEYREMTRSARLARDWYVVSYR